MGSETPFKFRVYDLRSYFAGQPGEMRCCPACGSPLVRSGIGPSKQVARDLLWQSMIPRHDFSYLYRCTVCQWWAIRESWSFCEAMQDMDYLIVGTATGPNPEASNTDPHVLPWDVALEDARVYDGALPLPDAIGKLFIGGKRK